MTPNIKHKTIFTRLLLIIILLTATFLHIWKLSEVPPGVNHDEGYYGLDGIRLIENPGYYPFFPGNNGREALFPYILSLVFRILEPSAFALRIIPAISGILCVAFIYAWARLMLASRSTESEWIAVLAAVFAATSFWGLQLHRTGFRVSLLPMFTTASYYFFWRGSLNKNIYNIIISGFFLGLVTSVYISGRITPFVFLLFTLYITMFYSKNSNMRILFTWKKLAILFFTALIVFSPLGLYFIQHPETFIYRSQQVAHEVGDIKYLIRSIRFFIDKGSTIWHFNIDDLPLIPGILPLFFWTGLAVTTKNCLQKKTKYIFLLISFIVPFSLILFTSPSSIRLASLFPPTCVLTAIGLYTPFSFVFSRLKIQTIRLTCSIVLVIISLILSTKMTFNLYFDKFANNGIVLVLWEEPFNSIASYIKHTVLVDKQNVLVPQEAIFHPSIHFLLKNDILSFEPKQGQKTLIKNQTIKIIWPPRWWTGLNELTSFVLLSPSSESSRGYVELVGQWKQEEYDYLLNLIATKGSEPTTEVIYNGLDQKIAYSIEVDRKTIIDSLHTTPKNKVNINFNNELLLLGYDYKVLQNGDLDIALFWKSLIHTHLEYDFDLIFIDNQNRNLIHTEVGYITSGSFLVPNQLIIDHYTINHCKKGCELQIELFELISNKPLKAFDNKGNYIGAKNIFIGVIKP